MIVTIDGVETDVLWEGLSVERTANGRDLLRCQVLSEDGSVRPGLDDVIILSDDATSPATVIFAGLITAARERGAGGVPDEPITTEITATDYKALASRQYMNLTLATGTLKSMLLTVVDYVPGVSLDAAQVDGPTIEALTYTAGKAEDVLNDLSILSGYVWEIDSDLKLRMFEPGTVAAPFNLTEAAQLIIGDVWVEPVRNSDYANRVHVQNGTLGTTAEDAAEIAAHGPWEIVYQAEDANTGAALQALADAILARSLPVLKTLEYTVDDLRLRPGMTQTINLPSRHVNNTFLIGDVSIRQAGDSDALWATVEATEGLVYRPGFRETYKRWNSGGGRAVNAAGGSGGISASVRYAHFLGGSGVEAVSSPTPTWVPVAGGSALGTGSYQVQLNTVARGTTAATITVRLKALDAGVSVQARLYDVTDSTPCTGTSAVVTNTDWELVTFGATLTAGSHLYELQLLPGAANAPVMGVGYLE